MVLNPGTVAGRSYSGRQRGHRSWWGALDEASRDLRDGYRRWRFWTALAWGELQQRFHRTYLGILWATFSFGIFCAVKILIFGTIFQIPFEFFAAYVVLGFLVWQLISGMLMAGCKVFLSAEGWIRGVPLPLSVFVYSSTAQVAILSAYAALAAIPFVFVLGYPQSAWALAALAALPVYLVTGILVQLILGTLCAAVGDLVQIVQTAVRIAFFLTPIVWLPEQLGARAVYAYYNPFTHYIAILRAPLLEGVVPWSSWLVVMACTAVLAFAAFAVFGRWRRRIVLWF